MSYNRLIYDNCAYTTEIKESTGPLEYSLYKGKYENAKKCPNNDFDNIIQVEDRADVENELFGLKRVNSKCPSLKFDPVADYKNPDLSPNKLCESIYFLTPNNLVKPTSNMLNEDNLSLLTT
jgi:hypothetical protein